MKLPTHRVLPRHVLAAALVSALISPVALAQNGNAAATAHERAGAMPAAQTRTDPRPPKEMSDPQAVEAPMTSKAPPEQSQAADQAQPHSAVVQRDAWAELDADGDGRVSADEGSIDADFSGRFAAMDGDGDGFVTGQEYRASAKSVGPVPPAQSQGATHAAQQSSVVQRDLWSRLDADGDGRISSVEGSLDADFSSMFEMTDADADGFVTDDEYRSHAKVRHSGDMTDEEEPTNDADDEPTPDESMQDE